MCECFRGKHHGRCCCCSTLVGMFLTGPISVGFFAYYMTLFIRSSEADSFNWLILIWTFLIGLPRVLAYFLLFADSLFNRKIYAMVLTLTTLLEFLIYAVNQIIIFTNNKDYCSRVYAVTYMVVEWDIYCDWAITVYEIGTTFSVLFYVIASMGAFDHYHMGFKNPHLKAKEIQRMELKYHAKQGDMRIKQDKHLAEGQGLIAAPGAQPGLLQQQQQPQMVMGPDGPMLAPVGGLQQPNQSMMMPPLQGPGGQQYSYSNQGPQYAPPNQSMMMDTSAANISQNNVSMNNGSFAEPNNLSQSIRMMQQPPPEPKAWFETPQPNLNQTASIGPNSERFTELQPQNMTTVAGGASFNPILDDSDMPASVSMISESNPQFNTQQQPMQPVQEEQPRPFDDSLPLNFEETEELRNTDKQC